MDVAIRLYDFLRKKKKTDKSNHILYSCEFNFLLNAIFQRNHKKLWDYF